MIDIIRKAYHSFREQGVEDPFEDSLRLLDILTSGWLSDQVQTAHIPAEPNLSAIARARREGVPLEYALGYAKFMGRVFHSGAGALIPRQETELLARQAIRLAADMPNPLSVIDIGTGSGNLAVTLAAELPGATVHATDISAPALDVARANVALHKLDGRVRLHLGSLFEPLEAEGLKGRVDIVVCNPPYIPRPSLIKLEASIRDHEPPEAFDGGAFGIDVFRGLIQGSLHYLREGGVLVFEIGAGQDRLVDRLLSGLSFAEVNAHPDSQGVARVVSATRAA